MKNLEKGKKLSDAGDVVSGTHGALHEARMSNFLTHFTRLSPFTHSASPRPMDNEYVHTECRELMNISLLCAKDCIKDT